MSPCTDPEGSRRLDIALGASRPMAASEHEEHIQFLRELSAGPSQRRSGREVDRLMGLLDDLDASSGKDGSRE